MGFAGPLRSEKGKEDFLQEVARVQRFLKDPWLIKARENATVQVKVPKISVSPAVPPPPPPQLPADEPVSVGGGGEEASAQVKRAALQKQAAATSLAAEDYARRFESGDLEVNDFISYFLYLFSRVLRNSLIADAMLYMCFRSPILGFLFVECRTEGLNFSKW